MTDEFLRRADGSIYGVKPRETRTVNGVTFTAWPEHGAWYEDPTDGGRVGTLMVPMMADGSMDMIDGEPNVVEIEVSYEDALGAGYERSR